MGTLPGFKGKLLRVFANVKVRGIPVGSVPLTPSEKQELLDKVQGHWKLQPLQGMGTNTIKHTNAFVRNDTIILSGGEVTVSQGYQPQGYQHHRTTKKTTTEQKIIPFRSPDGTIFVDNIGTILVRISEDNGELEFDNALGIKFLWQRGWKQNGLAPPTNTSTPLPTAPA